MNDVFICDAIRTPIGAYGGSLASVRADDLAAIPIKKLIERNPNIDWPAVNDVTFGCANQAGEDNRNIARMASLLAGLPSSVAGCTINRLCGSGMNAVGLSANSICCGEAELVIAGGAESMSRAPFVISKASSAFDRSAEMFDTTMGWRFINQKMDDMYGTEPMPKTAENLAEQFSISRKDQDKFALWSQHKAAAAQAGGRLAEEIAPVTITQRKGDTITFKDDQHPRLSSLAGLSKLQEMFPSGTITAGNTSGLSDGAAALLLASETAIVQHNLSPKARILGMAVAGVDPRIMGIGPVPATQKLLKRLNLTLQDMDVLEFNEAFAAQTLACTRQLALDDDDPRINPLGGAIALGHPLGMSGARLVLTAMYQLQCASKKRALCAMCVGVGQGIALVLERVH